MQCVAQANFHPSPISHQSGSNEVLAGKPAVEPQDSRNVESYGRGTEDSPCSVNVSVLYPNTKYSLWLWSRVRQIYARSGPQPGHILASAVTWAVTISFDWTDTESWLFKEMRWHIWHVCDTSLQGVFGWGGRCACWNFHNVMVVHNNFAFVEASCWYHFCVSLIYNCSEGLCNLFLLVGL